MGCGKKGTSTKIPDRKLTIMDVITEELKSGISALACLCTQLYIRIVE